MFSLSPSNTAFTVLACFSVFDISARRSCSVIVNDLKYTVNPLTTSNVMRNSKAVKPDKMDDARYTESLFQYPPTFSDTQDKDAEIAGYKDENI